MKGEGNFLQADKHQMFFQTDTIILDVRVCVCMCVCVFVDRHAQVTLNNKCASSLQFLKKEVSDQVDFIHEEKHESFHQIDVMIFDEDSQEFPKFPI